MNEWIITENKRNWRHKDTSSPGRVFWWWLALELLSSWCRLCGESWCEWKEMNKSKLRFIFYIRITLLRISENNI